MGQKRISVDGVEYPSIKKAGEEIGLTALAVCKRLDDDEAFPGWKRMPSAPRKPKQRKKPEDQTRISVATTHGRKAIFEQSLEVLGTDAKDFIHSAMLQASLNAIIVLENDLGPSVDVDTELMRQAVLKEFKRSGGMPVDLFD